MANKNQISLKVCGNPDANGGFQPLVIFNSPSIEIKDTVYAGCNTNSYFFTIKIENSQVVYKLIKNNVSSMGQSRHGCLIIAIAIPKGYKLAGGVSPYDVLMELKDGFMARCMTCKDATTDRYEFNSNRIQPNILDDIAGTYSLVSVSMPYRPMSIGSPIGAITASDVKIKQLMEDVQYPEFSKFSEVVVAGTVQSTNYTPIQNLAIPRVPEYSVYIDNALKGTVTDTTDQISVTGNGDTRYYENDTLSFTVEDLLMGRKIPNVTFDLAAEAIYINAKALIKPLHRVVKIAFDTKESEIYFKNKPGDLTLFCNSRPIKLTDDLTFTLTGEEIKRLSNAQNFEIVPNRNSEYYIRRIDISANEIKVEARKIEKPKQPIATSTGTGIKKPKDQNVSIDACEVQYITGSPEPGSLELFTLDGTILQSTILDFQAVGNDYVAKAYLPKHWLSSGIYARIVCKNDVLVYRYNLQIDNKGIVLLHGSGFTRKPVGFFSQHIKTIVMGGILILCFLGGCILGWNYTKKDTKKPEIACDQCDQTFDSDDALVKHKSVYHQSGPEVADTTSTKDTKPEPPVTPAPEHFNCVTCTRDFNSKSELDKHIDDMHSSKTCQYCSKTFEGKRSLDNHINSDHHFVCDECGRGTYFRTEKELNDHKRDCNVRGTDKPHKEYLIKER